MTSLFSHDPESNVHNNVVGYMCMLPPATVVEELREVILEPPTVKDVHM